MRVVLLLGILSCLSSAKAEVPVLRISLESSQKACQENSLLLQALQAEERAFENKADSRWALRWPRLSASANWQYLGEVPEMNLAGRTQALGDNHNYSVGPMLGWTLWDQGALKQSWQSARSLFQAKSDERMALGRQILLRTTVAYFQAQLALEQVRLLGDSLKLAQSQYRDIEARRKAGASSQIDSLLAHQEELSRRRLFRQARADAAEALRDLFALTGLEASQDLSLPFVAGQASGIPPGTEPASVYVSLDSPESSLSVLGPAGLWSFDESHPALRQMEQVEKAGKQAAQSARAGLWPKVQLTAKSSWDYPNGPKLESFNQNMVGVNAAFPLFEFKRTRQDAAEQENLAGASRLRREQILSDRKRDWLKAKDRLLSLQAQGEIDRESVAESQDLARRMYDSYKAGRSTLLEVQSANLRELEAKVQAVRTQAQTLMQLAILGDLAHQER